MGIFSTIKNAIFGDDETEEKNAKPGATPFGRKSADSVSEVDVEASLDAKEGADKLNWRTSIVDLMTLVGIDPSYENRKELATELGDTDYSGKAEENIWLHKQLMSKIAEAGGKVPPSLRD
ncbi:DUF3597 domain-containing protein [Aurantiacibacter sp. D1-12]|uniref:DUF3597 domain-containing protein n=1 Tax=Aurantiacibacter sp. D1-12 TaxID=2993658 RepID=UPI00237CFA1D|nr:DUF3597 domain-containing protein [Aurantiacibacter sp. D1-12]MDE1466644.1 DUF3597 domain-containing protein [Aurantiacibacter sp. D1-12]